MRMLRTAIASTCFAFIFTLQVPPVFSAETTSDPGRDERYLRAWLYRDFSTMYELTAPAARNGATAEAFSAAAAKLPVLKDSPSVVSRSGPADRQSVYFEVPSDSAPLRGSITLLPDGIQHPELSALLAPAPPAATATAQTASAGAVIDGMTLDDLLHLMDQKLVNVESLRVGVAVTGSMMGMPANEAGTLLYKAPNRLRLTLNSFVVNSSPAGETVLYVRPSNMIIKLGDLGTMEFAPGIGGSAAGMKEKYRMALVGKTTFKGEPAYEIRMTPPQSGALSFAPAGDIQLFVGANSLLPVGAKASGLQFAYANFEVNPSGISDSDFNYQPPKGAQTLSLDSVLGSLGGGMPGGLGSQ